MIRHQILSVRMSTRLVLRIGCFVFGCLFRAVTMQGESLRFASVRIWKRTQTTHPNTRKLSAICFCPYLEKNADYASSYEGTVCNFPLSLLEKEHRPHRRGRSARSNASLSLALARDLLSQPLWRCLKDWSSTHSSSKAAATAGHERERVTATSCASEASICVICGFSESIRRGCISVIQISTETIRKRK